MTLKEAYKQWSLQEKTRPLFASTRKIFSEVWSALPFHLECKEYTKQTLAEALVKSKNLYQDKVKAASVMTNVLKFGLSGEPLNFNYTHIIDTAGTLLYGKEKDKPKEDKPKQPDIFKPLFKDKPLIPQEITEPKKPIGKPVYQLDVEGKVIKKFDNVKLAAKELDIREASVYKAISTKNKFNGFFWSRTPEIVIPKEPIKKNKEPNNSPVVTTVTVDVGSMSKQALLFQRLRDLMNEIKREGINITVTLNL